MTQNKWSYINTVDDSLELVVLNPEGSNLLAVTLFDDSADRESEIVMPSEKARLLRDWLIEQYPLALGMRDGVSVLDVGHKE